MVFRNQHLGLRYAHYCIYCLYGYLSIFTENHWFTPIHSIPSSNTEFILIFSLSIFVNPFTDSGKLNFCYPQCIYVFDPSTYKYQYPSLLPPLHTLLRLQHLVLGSPPTSMPYSTCIGFGARHLATLPRADNPFTLLRFGHLAVGQTVM